MGEKKMFLFSRKRKSCKERPKVEPTFLAVRTIVDLSFFPEILLQSSGLKMWLELYNAQVMN